MSGFVKEEQTCCSELTLFGGGPQRLVLELPVRLFCGGLDVGEGIPGTVLADHGTRLPPIFLVMVHFAH